MCLICNAKVVFFVIVKVFLRMWSFKIAVETAAGTVFLLIIKPKPWVRRDGLS